MSDFYTQLITVFLGIFAIMNPIANTAVFAGLTGDKDKSDQFKIAAKSLISKQRQVDVKNRRAFFTHYVVIEQW